MDIENEKNDAKICGMMNDDVTAVDRDSKIND